MLSISLFPSVTLATVNACESYFMGWPWPCSSRHHLFDANWIGSVLNPPTADPTGVSNVRRSKTTPDLWQWDGHSVFLGAWEHDILSQHSSLQDHFHFPPVSFSSERTSLCWQVLYILADTQHWNRISYLGRSFVIYGKIWQRCLATNTPENQDPKKTGNEISVWKVLKS